MIKTYGNTLINTLIKAAKVINLITFAAYL